MMRSATAFLPDSMMTFMNLDRSIDPNFGSGRISRLGTSRRRGISLFLCLQLARALPPSPRAPPTSGAAHLLGKLTACRNTPRPHPPARATPSLRFLGTLGTVLRAGLLAILHALQVQRAAHDVVAHARQVLHAA